MSDEGPIHGECTERFAPVRRAFERNFRRHGELGASVAVYQDGEPVVDLWGGFADAARTRPWERDTLVHVASTTKGLTALCLHRLADEGRLDLDAPVAHYWPEFAQAGKAGLPVHMLLSHRAGLPAIRRRLPREARYDWERMCAALAAEAPWWEPGTRHGYHAMTFGWLVGEVLRRIDGRSVGTFLREEIATPLGIDFHIGLSPAKEARCADVVWQGNGGGNPLLKKARKASAMADLAFSNPPGGPDEFNSEGWRRSEIPAANGHANARAIARAYAALACGGSLDGVRLLGPDQLALATTEQAFGPDAVLADYPMRYALGFLLGHPRMPFGPSPRAFGHPGMGGSLGVCDPDARLGFGYAMNCVQSGMAGDARGFALLHAVYACLKV